MSRTRWKNIWQRFSGRGAYPHQLAFLLLVPMRRLVFSPRQLIAHLPLTPRSRVLEVGPGPGFFSIDVARAIPDGRLELADLQRQMLDKARRRLRRAGVRNVGFTQADAVALPFRPDTFDVAFLVAVLGEVPSPAACLASIANVLRPGGVVAVAELPGDPDVLTEADLKRLACGTGLAFVSSVRVARGSVTTFRRSAAAKDTGS